MCVPRHESHQGHQWLPERELFAFVPRKVGGYPEYLGPNRRWPSFADVRAFPGVNLSAGGIFSFEGFQRKASSDRCRPLRQPYASLERAEQQSAKRLREDLLKC